MKLLIVPFLLIGISAKAQKVIATEPISQFTTYVKGTNFEGVIFSKEYNMQFYQNTSAELRFTPSIEDIELVEGLLRKQLKKVNQGINQGKHVGPRIHKKLKKYQRQYIGFISENGERYIYLNCNWHRHNLLDRIKGDAPPSDGWKTEFWMVFDGGSYHWNVQINLDKKQLINLDVNGVA